jgi:predicted ATPase
MLTRLKIRGFKSIRDQEIELKSLNILIGNNGAGKSNLVSFFDMIGFLKTGALQQYVGQSGSADSLLYFGTKTTPVLAFTIEFSVKNGVNAYDARLAHAARDTLIFVEERVGYRPTNGQWKWKSLGAGHLESRLEEANAAGDKTASTVLWQLRRCSPYHFHDTSAGARIRNKSYIEDNSYLRADAGNLAAFLFRLREHESKTYLRIIRTIQQVVPQFVDFDLSPSVLDQKSVLLNWRQRGQDYLFGPHQFSDGTLRSIALISALSQEPSHLPILTVIDEPELGLHPYAITIVASLMRSLAATGQLIASTQSTTLLDQFDPSDVLVIDRRDGESVFSRPDEATLNEWLSDYSMSELWEKNVIGGRPA